MKNEPPIRYSVVVPFYNEQENIPPLYVKLTEVMDAIGERYELVFASVVHKTRMAHEFGGAVWQRFEKAQHAFAGEFASLCNAAKIIRRRDARAFGQLARVSREKFQAPRLHALL